MVVLITGANGQLGQAIQSISGNYPEIDFVFCDSSKLDISNLKNVEQIFAQYKPNYCINAAAYTAVDKAESEPEKAHSINVIGAKNLAEVCKKSGVVLLHISTDFVFDGNRSVTLSAVEVPYSEEDIPNPTGVYGQTKLDGEKAIQDTFDNYYIIRTSWVYSQFANNFMKTMLRLASERESLSVVNDQIGTPTNAVDLAEVLVKIICHTELAGAFGIYNFSNEGKCSWYDFAKKIFEINNIKIDLKPIPTSSFPTPAKRPSYSVLDKSKIKNTFGIAIMNWETRLKTIDFSVITEKKP
ncbi:dTDP-4-dehydrorhamnose reductase [Flavobacterium sp. SUN052]|uniref:dTDP-4-dehydrorhamnose reductase n=1 Tax=Flavobacterium sp. SUN052 TaxID=3002441 RepID=UPI00237D7B5A|nr:dTDP-4-dehydrorhamnose reductase [Flavobacterium sp. SUN052]MEC4003525.1 dTDP-4-dehydrorhamnose reductase [Flavobacterium sp. SUN052]